ncbi:Predicted regulator of Ras-like GTPase activity, Roadblock/LC7/MglB family [Streptomyces zhaozhouensis]|uniref:Predicted regulator of Ras-like GTPase activity, Roadblock/LC7/MglB family n=1 Tax=Streptomyces zhaozhouensis TaxID=1300267 RepID=A0A286DZH0_9ACTN|nr:roadblock/LC7 domain-containing protein [Streptomyces zhaozhouensis]SOD64068.1 Predicted regulator of Ras-like GTPase activity, Roadblock/LC7/MglB family [Streptomyces zhaozhouensis]
MTVPEPTTPGPAERKGQPAAESLDPLLDELVARVPGIRHALLLAADGLARGASSALGREDSEQLAAVASGFHSLARGVGQHFDTGTARQTLVELDEAFLLVTAAGSGSALAVLTDPEAEVGQVAYEMALLVKRLGPLVAIPPRRP